MRNVLGTIANTHKDEKAHAWAKLGEKLQSILDNPCVNIK